MTVEIDTLREHTRSGRPCGNEGFVVSAEGITGRILKKRRPGRKLKRKQVSCPRNFPGGVKMEEI